jgi:hypothetical protein
MFLEVGNSYFGQINQLVKNKWDSATVRAIVLNSIEEGGQDGLLKILAPRLGVDIEKGSLPARVTAQEGKDGARYLQTFRTSENNVARAVKRMESLRPGSRTVQIDKAEDVIDAIVKYGLYGKLSPKEIQNYVGQVIGNDGSFGASAKNVDVLKNVFSDIGVKLVDLLDESILYKGQGSGKMGQKALSRKEDLKAAIIQSTKLFLGGKTGESVNASQRLGNGTDLAYYQDDVGNKIGMPKIQLESELLNGFLNLPNVDEWGQVISRTGRALSRLEPVENAYEFFRTAFDNFFRTGLLVFRVAYALRNSAEMQIRMFLNGHHSIFTDPVTLTGMTIGNFATKNKQGSFLQKAFAPYSQTVLDTAFEVGNDEALAFANGVETYFGMTRQSHSLADPRVFPSAIKDGWRNVTFDSPDFAAGWGSELITLHRSSLARVVLGGFPGSKSTNGVEHQDAAVAWLLGNDRIATQTREQLIAYNDEYKQILGSESMTKDFLFDNVNSVYNRVKMYTMNDAVLEDFVRTGRWMGDGMEFNLSGIPQLKDRVNRLQGALKTRFYKNPEKKETTSAWMVNNNVNVPWSKLELGKRSTGAFDWFFKQTNRIERLGTVGPEFRLAYWDRIAQLAPGLNAAEVARALKAAETTLRGMKRMMPEKRLKMKVKMVY